MKAIQYIFLSLWFLTSSVAVAEYSDMVVFGDSLSDPGNVFVAIRKVSVRPYDAGNIPSAPYPVGGLTFSNGKTWIQQVSASLKLKSGTGPALRTTAFLNYGFGGARAASSAGGPFDLSAQVEQYLVDVGGSSDSEALYSIYFGNNDVRDALVAFNMAFEQTLLSGGTPLEALAAGEAAAAAIIIDAVTSITTNIGILSNAGARNFLVPNIPNAGLSPAVKELGSDVEMLATQLSIGFNLALADALSNIPVVTITQVDMFSLSNNMVTDPDSFGLSNIEEACLIPGVKKGAVCKHPDEFLFWDGIHPTRVVHGFMAEEALSELY